MVNLSWAPQYAFFISHQLTTDFLSFLVLIKNIVTTEQSEITLKASPLFSPSYAGFFVNFLEKNEILTFHLIKNIHI